MTDKNQIIQVFFAHALKRIRLRRFVTSCTYIVFIVIAMASILVSIKPSGVDAATSDNINFQARLQNTTGSIAPDGYYNIQFKLYDALSGGSLLWTETYYDSNGVTAGNDNRLRVANGYVTVNLGSLTSFPSTIPWDQQLYLTMNVGGTTQTATPTYDGEMTPRLKLTAVPYAFNAKNASQLLTTNGAFTSTLQLQPTTTNQIFQIADQGAAGTYTLLTQQSAGTVLANNFIQNQYSAAQTAEYWISGRARADNGVLASSLDTAAATALGIGTTNATTINLGNASTSSINLNSATIATNQATVNILNTTTTTVNAFGQALDVNLGAADGRLDIASDSIYLGMTGSASLIGVGTGLDVRTVNQTVASTNSDYIIVSSGNASGATSSTGTTTVTTGNSTTSGSTGATQIWTGNATSGSSGSILMDVGTATTTTGAINIGATNASSVIIGNTTNAANAVNIRAGTTGLINLQSDVRIGSGAAVSNLYATGASSLNIMTISQAAASTASGNIWINSGNVNGATSNSGSVSLGSGNSNTSGNSGNAFVRTGNATNGNSGNIFIDPGTASTTAGYIQIGVNNASAVTIGRTGTGTFINGNVDIGSFAGSGVVTSTSTGILQTGILDRNNTTYFNTALSIANGGTGSTTYTTNGVVYAGATGLQSTAVGATGQCLVGNTGAAPTWGSCGLAAEADTLATVTSRGASTTTAVALQGGAIIRGLTIDNATANTDTIIVAANSAVGASTVFAGTITNADLTAARTWTLPNLSGTVALTSNNQTFTNTQTFSGTLSSTGTTSITGAATTIGDAAADSLTIGATIQGTNALLFEGSSVDANDLTIAITNPTAPRTITLPDVTGTVITTGNLSGITGLTDGQISDTLTASIFIGSGSTTNAVDLDTAEVAGTLGVNRGGTGVTTFTSNGILYGNGTGALLVTAAGTTGQCLQGSTGSAPTWATCGVTSMGAIDGHTKTATGATIASGVLYLQSADASNPGLMTTAGQTIAGNKTFTGQTTLGGAVNQSQLIIKANSSQSSSNPLIVLQSSASAELARLTADSGFNTAFGYQAMPVVTAIGQYNVGLGAYALSSLTDGDNNSGFGYGALFNTTTGIGNIGFGYRGMRANTTGSYNMGMGYSAGYLDSGGVFGTGATLQNATAIGAYAQVQASNSIVLGSVDTATKVGIGTTVPLNTFSVSPLAYATGTASQSGTTVTGSGTTWTSGMIGNQIVFADGTSATVTGFTDATHLTVTPSQTVASQAYRMHLPGLQVESDGNVAIGRTSASYSLDVGGTTKTDLFINRGVLTTSSGASGVANWTKIGTCHLYAQNEECRSLISFVSVGVSSDTEDRAKLDFIVKQQTAMASAPWVRIVVDESVGYTKDSFVAVTTTNTATDTVVDLYFQYQANKLNQQFSIAPQHTSGTRFFEPFSYQSLSTTLPAGTQTWGKIPAQTGLLVENWNATDYAAKFVNQSTATTADGIYIQAGPAVGTRTSGNVFAAFGDSSGTVNGRIYGNATGVTYGTTGADIAEYFKADSSNLPQVGELVTVDKESSNAVYRAKQGDMLVGIVSNQSGYIGNGPSCENDEQELCVSSYEKSHVVVGLLGQVPLKVNIEGGVIRPGDPITASSVPGVGTKAIGNVNIVGYALTTVNAEGYIQVILQPHQASQSLQGSNTAFASLTVGGTTSIQGSLSVTGDTTLANVVINGQAVFNGAVVINGTLETADIRINGHITLKGVAPMVTIGNALGVGDVGINATDPVVTVNGTDGTGTIAARAGTQAVTSGVIAHLTFSQAFDTSHKVIASASNSGGADVRIYVSKTSDGFDIISRDSLTVGQTYTFDYVVMGADQQQP